MGSQPRWAKPRDSSPGPGQYDSLTDARHIKSPTAVMGKASKSHQQFTQSPGPGNYDTAGLAKIKSVRTPEPTFSKSSKYDTKQGTSPDYYNIPAAYPNAPPYDVKDWKA
jgi:hypothetical protein